MTTVRHVLHELYLVLHLTTITMWMSLVLQFYLRRVA